MGCLSAMALFESGGHWTPSFVLARQALYQPGHISSLITEDSTSYIECRSHGVRCCWEACRSASSTGLWVVLWQSCVPSGEASKRLGVILPVSMAFQNYVIMSATGHIWTSVLHFSSRPPYTVSQHMLFCFLAQDSSGWGADKEGDFPYEQILIQEPSFNEHTAGKPLRTRYPCVFLSHSIQGITAFQNSHP